MVYVDNMEAPYKGMIMCHMIADTTEELIEMVRKIGVKEKWIQYPGTHKEHFDICLAKKKLAIKHGAKEISAYDLARMLNLRKGSPMKKLQEKWDAEDAEKLNGGRADNPTVVL
jgi:hypothetical protein